MNVFVDAVGCAAPGMENWAQARAVLRGQAAYVPAELSAYQPDLLPPNERRRAAPAVRLAFRIAEDALAGSALKPAELAAVFASSEGDTGILHRLCSALAEPQRAVSPTDFHNSVHNAAAGYWSIAAGARRASTSLSAFDASFAAGLLEAAALVSADGVPVLLAAYDVVPPAPLFDARPIAQPFGAALVLRADAGAARLRIAASADEETVMDDAALEALRRANPAARALPLLRLLARAQAGRVVFAGVGAQRWALELA